MDEEKDKIIEVDKVEDSKQDFEEEKVVEEPVVEVIEDKKEKKDRKGFSIAALVLGIVSIVLFCLWYISIPCGILAVIFGILGIKSTRKGMSIAGLVTGAIGLIVSVLIVAALFMFGIAIGITDGLDNLTDEYYYHYKYDDNLFD